MRLFGDAPAHLNSGMLANCCYHTQVRARGFKLSRRFQTSDPLSVLFNFCEGAGAHVLPDSYKIVTTHPRKVLTRAEADTATFASIGLTSKQEAVILEPLAPA